MQVQGRILPFSKSRCFVHRGLFCVNFSFLDIALKYYESLQLSFLGVP